ncbi:MAG TPA: TIGR03663 family protein [Candidatus Paceibacterota bacterium]|nr:TIGR03663 family protein [Candidatus Paceibacterota bacterium]
MSRWLVIGLVLLAAGAAVLRLPQLGRRPMHTDESVHTLKFRDLLQDGQYRYDPDEFHGPSLYYFTLPVIRLLAGKDFAQSTESQYRLVPLAFGVGLILLLALVTDGLGRKAILFSGFLTAISPAMVFYSRYFIHELILVFFTFLFLASLWRYSHSRNIGWSLLAGFGLGMMHATKETWVMVAAAAGGAWILNELWAVWKEGKTWQMPAGLNWRHGLAGLLVAIAVAIVLFTSFFTHADGPLDSIRTYGPWFRRAEGQTTHVHPWHYYFGLLAWFHRPKGPVFSEALILVCAVAGVFGTVFRPHPQLERARFGRFLVFSTVLLALIYALIPYKTPWCLLGFYHGIILLAGVGLAFLWDWARNGRAKAVFLVLFTLGSLHLLGQAYLAAYRYEADPKNPYVYAHTMSHIKRLVETVEKAAQVHPQKNGMLIKVMVPGSDYWPLPWYLRKLTHVEWWPGLPQDWEAPVIISSPKMDDVLDPKVHGLYVPAGLYPHRPRPPTFLQLYVKLDLWAEYLKAFPPQRDEDEESSQ